MLDDRGGHYFNQSPDTPRNRSTIGLCYFQLIISIRSGSIKLHFIGQTVAKIAKICKNSVGYGKFNIKMVWKTRMLELCKRWALCVVG